MKKIVFVALAMLMAISGCKAGEQAEGAVVTEKRSVGKFSGVTLIGPYNVVCTQGEACSVTVEAPKEVAGKLQTEVKDGVLTISREKIAGVRVVDNGKDANMTTVYVTLPMLRSVALIGSGDVVVKGKVTSDDRLSVSLSGSGDIAMGDVEVRFANFSLAGSGDVKAANVKGMQMNMSLAGSGDVSVKSVEADKADFSLAGSGDVRVGNVAAANVTVSSAGSGDMEIDKVDCAVLTVNQTSSSDVAIRNVKAVTTNVNKTGSGDVKIAGTTNFYNELKHGSGKIDTSNLRCKEGKQTKQGGGLSVSGGTTSPSGIEPEP